MVSEIQAETDCKPTGTFRVENDTVQIQFTECVAGEEKLVLQLGEDDEHLLYTEFLIDNDGEKYYNTASEYEAGTNKTATIEGESYSIKTLRVDPAVNDSVLLHSRPSIDSSHYVLTDYAGKNDTRSLLVQTEEIL